MNLTIGLFMAVIQFLFSVWTVIWSYQPDPVSTLAFAVMASLAAMSLLATWLLGLAAVGVTGVYAVAKLAETAQVQHKCTFLWSAPMHRVLCIFFFLASGSCDFWRYHVLSVPRSRIWAICPLPAASHKEADGDVSFSLFPGSFVVCVEVSLNFSALSKTGKPPPRVLRRALETGT